MTHSNHYDVDPMGSKVRLIGFGRARSRPRSRARIRSRFVQSPVQLALKLIKLAFVIYLTCCSVVYGAGIKAILFDTFGTVVDWRGSMVKELQVVFKEKKITGVDCEDFVEDLVMAYAKKMEDISSHQMPFATVDELNSIAVDNTLRSYGLYEKFTPEERTSLWMMWHRLEAWPDAVPALTELKKNYIIGTLSNGNVKLLIDLSKRDHLDWDVILSGEFWHCYKPDPLVYQHAVQVLNIQPSEILLVASHAYDLEAAQQAGFKTAYIFRPLEFREVKKEQYVPDKTFDFVLKNLTELPSRVASKSSHSTGYGSNA